MTSSVRISSSTNSSMWPPKVPGNDVFSSNSCSVPKLATLPEGAPRSRHSSCSARLRPSPVRGGSAHFRACPAARRSLVHRRSPGETWPHSNCPDADLGQGCNRCLDVPGYRNRRLYFSTRKQGRPSGGRTLGREGCLADAPAVRDGSWCARHRTSRFAPYVRQIVPRGWGRA